MELTQVSQFYERTSFPRRQESMCGILSNIDEAPVVPDILKSVTFRYNKNLPN
jgi:hypothetical protein